MPHGIATHAQIANSHQRPLVIHKTIDTHCNTFTGIPVSTMSQRIFFNSFLFFITYAISPIDSTEKFSISLSSRLMFSMIPSFFCPSAISSQSVCSCWSSRTDMTFSGCSSDSSSLMPLMEIPASRRKQMIRIRFRSSSEYSLRPPSDNSLGTRMFLES